MAGLGWQFAKSKEPGPASEAKTAPVLGKVGGMV